MKRKNPIKDKNGMKRLLNWGEQTSDFEEDSPIALANKRGEYVDINLPTSVPEPTYSFVAESTKENEPYLF